MGAWGTGVWENDDALDWIVDLEEQGESAVFSSLVTITPKERLDTGSCCRALAAVEVIAAAAGRQGPGLPEEVESWISEHDTLRLVGFSPLARDVVRHIDANSELQKLFDENEYNHKWHASMSSLQHRLEDVSQAVTGQTN